MALQTMRGKLYFRESQDILNEKQFGFVSRKLFWDFFRGPILKRL